MKKIAFLVLLSCGASWGADGFHHVSPGAVESLAEYISTDRHVVDNGAAGDMLVLGVAGVVVRKPKGADGTVLQMAEGQPAWTALPTSVTSVGLSAPTAVFDVSGSPVTTTGTLALEFDTQAANKIFAGPATGAAATPAFRDPVDADIPAAIARDTELHAAATVSGTPDYITLNGQDIVRGTVDIGDDTNLAGTANEITLTGDTLSLHSAIARDTELPVGANPTASVAGAAVNGSAATFMRSDAAPALADPIVPVDGFQNFTGGLTCTENMTLAGTTANVLLGSNFLSGDGGDEGVSVAANGVVTLTSGLDCSGDAAFNDNDITGVTSIRGYDSYLDLGTSTVIIRNFTNTANAPLTASTITASTAFSGPKVTSGDNPGHTHSLLDNIAPADGVFDITGGLTCSENMTLGGTTANIALGANWLSGDGGDEGIQVDADGNIGLGGAPDPMELIQVYGDVYMNLNDLAAIGALDCHENLTLSGTVANIVLGANYLSGDGGDEGVSVEADGDALASADFTIGAGDLFFTGASAAIDVNGSGAAGTIYLGDTNKNDAIANRGIVTIDPGADQTNVMVDLQIGTGATDYCPMIYLYQGATAGDLATIKSKYMSIIDDAGTADISFGNVYAGAGANLGNIFIKTKNGIVRAAFTREGNTGIGPDTTPDYFFDCQGIGHFDGDVTTDGKISSTTITTFTADDTTPTVAAGNVFKVPATWTAGHDITAFDAGVAGQEITVIGGDTDCAVVDGGTLLIAGNWTATAAATLTLINDGSNWYEKARSVN